MEGAFLCYPAIGFKDRKAVEAWLTPYHALCTYTIHGSRDFLFLSGRCQLKWVLQLLQP